MRRRSRQSWLILIFLVTAVLVSAVHVARYGVEYRNGHYALIGHGAGSFPAFHYKANYSRIEDGLWLGGFVDAPPPDTQAVLNLCESKDPYQVQWHRWDAIHDSAPAPTLEWLDREVRFIESERAAGHSIYVHCFGGISRSGMVMTAYLMRREGWSCDQAIRFLRTKRPVVNPNPAFMALLNDWERSSKPAPATSQPAG